MISWPLRPASLRVLEKEWEAIGIAWRCALSRCVQVTSYEQQQAAESLYRDANTLLYADNKPSEDAIDRVVGKINAEYVRSMLS